MAEDGGARVVLRGLVRDTGALGAALGWVVAARDQARLDEPEVEGPAWLAERFETLDGTRMLFADPRVAPLELLGLFRPRRSGPASIAAHPWGGWLRTAGVHSVAAQLVTVHGRALGAVWLFGAEPLPASSRGAVDQAVVALRACAPFTPEAAGAVLVGRDGSLTPSAAPVARWLAEVPRRARLLVARAQGQGALGGMRLQWLDGEAAGLAGIVMLEPARTVRVPLALRLSPAQQRIAADAARGATLPEIALANGMAVETARSHLKTVYRRLAVSNRVELAEALRASAVA